MQALNVMEADVFTNFVDETVVPAIVENMLLICCHVAEGKLEPRDIHQTWNDIDVENFVTQSEVFEAEDDNIRETRRTTIRSLFEDARKSITDIPLTTLKAALIVNNYDQKVKTPDNAVKYYRGFRNQPGRFIDHMAYGF